MLLKEVLHVLAKFSGSVGFQRTNLYVALFNGSELEEHLEKNINYGIDETVKKYFSGQRALKGDLTRKIITVSGFKKLCKNIFDNYLCVVGEHEALAFQLSNLVTTCPMTAENGKKKLLTYCDGTQSEQLAKFIAGCIVCSNFNTRELKKPTGHSLNFEFMDLNSVPSNGNDKAECYSEGKFGALPHILTKTNVPFVSEREIIHRERELDLIKELLKHQKMTLLTHGFGGIGKTSIARVLYARLSNQYDSIGWVEYRENLKLSLLASIDLYEDIEDQSKRWGMLERRLKNDSSKKILFIDNVDRDSSHGQDPIHDTELMGVSGWPNMTVVLTSRLELIPGYHSYKVDGLGDEKHRKEWCTDLFYLYFNTAEYNKPMLERQNTDTVFKLVELAGYHTYAIELLAKSAKYQDSLDFYLERVKESGFSFPKVPVLTLHSHAYAEAAIQLRKLFDMSTRTEKERQILWDFAVLPNINLSVTETKDWMGYTESDLDQLVCEGWITYRNGFSLHPLVKEVILLDLQCGKAPVGTLSKWESHLSRADFIAIDEVYTTIIRKLDISDNFFRFVPVTDKEKRAQACFSVGQLFFSCARKRITAISCLEASLCIYNELESSSPGVYEQNIVNVSYSLGYIESATSGYREKCDIHLLQAWDLSQKLEKKEPGKFQVEVANASDHLGYVWSDVPDRRQDAEALLLQALSIRKKLSKDCPAVYLKSLGTTCDNLGRLLTFDQTRWNEAEHYLREAYSIRRSIEAETPGSQLTEVAWTCNNLGDLLSAIEGRGTEAEDYYREALAIREKMEAENPGLYAGNIIWTNVCLSRLLYRDKTRWSEVENICQYSLKLCSEIDAEHKGFFIDECAAECQKILTEIAEND